MDTANSPYAPGGFRGDDQPEKQKKTMRHKTYRFIKKYWFILAVLIVLAVGAVTWWVLAAQNAAAWQRATDAFERADYASAEEELSGLGVPSDEERLRIYSQTMLATGNLDKALEGYNKLYDINSDASVKLIIGNIYNQQKKYDKAIEIYKDIIAKNSGNTQAYINLATVYRLQGENDRAIAVAADAVEENPNSVVLLELQVSMLLDDEGSDAYDEAVDALRAANPEDPLLTAIGQ